MSDVVLFNCTDIICLLVSKTSLQDILTTLSDWCTELYKPVCFMMVEISCCTLWRYTNYTSWLTLLGVRKWDTHNYITGINSASRFEIARSIPGWDPGRCCWYNPAATWTLTQAVVEKWQDRYQWSQPSSLSVSSAVSGRLLHAT